MVLLRVVYVPLRGCNAASITVSSPPPNERDQVPPVGRPARPAGRRAAQAVKGSGNFRAVVELHPRGRFTGGVTMKRPFPRGSAPIEVAIVVAIDAIHAPVATAARIGN